MMPCKPRRHPTNTRAALLAFSILGRIVVVETQRMICGCCAWI